MLLDKRVRRGLCAVAGALCPFFLFGQASAAEPAERHAPYSYPWQLRSLLAEGFVRLDTSIALYEDGGSSVVPMLSGSFVMGPKIAGFVRLGLVSNSPTVNEDAFGFLNPELGLQYVHRPVEELWLALTLGLSVPLGSGGEQPTDLGTLANRAGALARSGFDNPHFAVNHLGVLPGMGLGYIAHGLTLQAEITVNALARVRGTATGRAVDVELTTGFFAGYLFAELVSVGAELRYQRWMSSPVAPQERADEGLEDIATLAFGPRLHLRLSPDLALRPGVSVTIPLDNPMAERNYTIIGVDLPLTF